MVEEIITPLTRKDVLEAIKNNGGKSEGLRLADCTLEEKVDLQNLYLCGIILNDSELIAANFNGSDLDGAVMRRANLQNATFNSCTLVKADFRGSYLKNAEFREADLPGAQFCKDPFRSLRANIEQADFRGANLFGADFTGCAFYKSKLEKASIESAHITTEGTRLGDADWGNYFIGEEKLGKFDIAEHRYRHLKAWYTNAGYYDIAAKFQYRENEARRKGLRFFSKSWGQRLLLQLSYLLFGHGEGWKRLLFGWILGFILGLALLYFGLRGIATYTLTGTDFLNSLYYSAVSFTSLGYGPWFDSISVQGWARGFGAAESFMGVVMMALLIAIFIRKWTR